MGSPSVLPPLSPAVSPSRPVRRFRLRASASTLSEASVDVAAWYKGRNVIQILRERGLLNDVTSPKLEEVAARKQVTVYCGFDPTADSLHLGNLLGIIVMSWFQRCGHRPVALVGGATGRVGDPSGKSAERPIMSDETIEKNIEG